MAAVLRVTNFCERENIERQRLLRVFSRYLSWEVFSDEKLLKRYRFGRKSLLFIVTLIEDEVSPLIRQNQAHHLKGPPAVFLWDCIIPEFGFFFCNLGHVSPFLPNLNWCVFLIF